MELHFQPGPAAGQLVVRIVGDLDLYAAVSFSNTVASKIDEGCRLLVLDLQDLRYLDSSGVGALIRLLQKCRAVSGALRVAHLAGTPRKVLEMSNIIHLLKEAPTIEAALGAGA